MPADLVDIAIAAIFLVAVVGVWKVGGNDPVWEERWRELSPADRARVVAAARSGALLASPEKIELAAAFARRDRRRRGPYNFLYAVRIPIGLALIAGGLVASSLLFLLFGILFLLTGLWSLRRAIQISRAERETIARDRRFYGAPRGGPARSHSVRPLSLYPGQATNGAAKAPSFEPPRPEAGGGPPNVLRLWPENPHARRHSGPSQQAREEDHRLPPGPFRPFALPA